MKNVFLLPMLIIIIGLFSCTKEQQKAPTEVSERQDETGDVAEYSKEEVSFKTGDDIIIYGDLFKNSKSAPMIILFHQARGSARGEYETIIPRLTKKGYNVLAIDQRSGGDQFGSPNRTVVARSGESTGYCEAYPDFEAALKFVHDHGFTGKKFVWGSSYSAALVINLAANNEGEVDGVLAFSPASGGPMKDCSPAKSIEIIETPLIIFRPAKEMEVPSIAAQLEQAKNKGHQTFIAENGVHGSSMLVEERTKADVEKTWEEVFAFIEKITS